MAKIVINNKEKGYGSYDENTNVIAINRKRHKGKKKELLDTLVHEGLHAKHHKMTERTVRTKTKKVIARMSPTQKQQQLGKLRGALESKVKGLKKKYKLVGDTKPGDIINTAKELNFNAIAALI